jgi:tRNA-Thr(GGU) m(6)t(6)A37 methyltransferase TsaA
MIDITHIGKVHSPLKSIDDCPRQESENAPEATIEIFPKYQAAASHIKDGDSLLLLTWLDKADRSVQETHPRNDIREPLTGVFSTRSPDRPNPIGIHLIKVLHVTGDGRFKVSALEVLDNTPVIDIKST